MPHRTVNIADLRLEVFDTGLGAQHWIKRHKGDCIVIARNSFYFQRKDGAEVTIRLNATICPENSHIISAANTLADLAEKELEKAA